MSSLFLLAPVSTTKLFRGQGALRMPWRTDYKRFTDWRDTALSPASFRRIGIQACAVVR